jgi:ribosomal protein L11 methyltransferase
VTAIDIDPVAVEVARENIEINDVAEAIEVREAQAGTLDETAFDLIVANLTAELLLYNMTQLAESLKDEGILILSGVLTDQAGEVQEAARGRHLSLLEQTSAGEWCGMVLKRYTLPPK